MSDQWIDRLSEYLDGELPPDERVRLDAHLRECAECTATLIELKRVTVRARALTDRDPQNDLWPDIAARIGATPASGVPAVRGQIGRRWSFSIPQLAAAAVALMLLSGGAAWWIHPAATTAPLATGPAPAPSVAPITVSTTARSGGYDRAVSDLQRVLDEGRGRLDTTTVRVIERNLAAIDSAIMQAQRAVAADSGNTYLNSHLAEIRRRKLELLRQAANLVTAVS
jgi:hypothetical protein